MVHRGESSASRRNRFSRSGSEANSAGSTLSATSRQAWYRLLANLQAPATRPPETAPSPGRRFLHARLIRSLPILDASHQLFSQFHPRNSARGLRRAQIEMPVRLPHESQEVGIEVERWKAALRVS